MLHNVGKIDRLIRVVLAIVLLVIYLADFLEGSWNTAFLVGAAVLFMTSLNGCCPLYALLGFGTCKIDHEGNDPKIKTRKLDL
jgi:hypothetical protein